MPKRLSLTDPISSTERPIGWVETSFVTRESEPIFEGDGPSIGELIDNMIRDYRENHGRELLTITFRFPEKEA